MEQLIAFFNQITPLSEETIRLMTELYVPATIKKEEYFIRKGHYAKEIAFLEKGIVRAYYIDQSGKE